MFNKIVSLFVGEDSKKRQMGIGAFGIVSVLFLFGVVDIESYKVAMSVIGFWVGFAFSARMTKISKHVVIIKKDLDK